jgi:hypothetical protein
MNFLVTNNRLFGLPWTVLQRRAPTAAASDSKILAKYWQISSQNGDRWGFLTCCVLSGPGYLFDRRDAAQVWEMTNCTKTTPAWPDELPGLAGI